MVTAQGNHLQLTRIGQLEHGKRQCGCIEARAEWRPVGPCNGVSNALLKCMPHVAVGVQRECFDALVVVDRNHRIANEFHPDRRLTSDDGKVCGHAPEWIHIGDLYLSALHKRNDCQSIVWRWRHAWDTNQSWRATFPPFVGSYVVKAQGVVCVARKNEDVSSVGNGCGDAAECSSDI